MHKATADSMLLGEPFRNMENPVLHSLEGRWYGIGSQYRILVRKSQILFLQFSIDYRLYNDSYVYAKQ